MKRLVLICVTGLAVSGCAFLAEARDDEVPSARELGAGECQQAGPHDAAAPGEWICDRGDNRDEVRPRHRVENLGLQHVGVMPQVIIHETGDEPVGMIVAGLAT